MARIPATFLRAFFCFKIPTALGARSTFRVYAVADYEQDDLLLRRLEANMASKKKHGPNQSWPSSIVSAINQFSKLATRVCLVELSSFMIKALTHRSRIEGGKHTNRLRASLFRAIMEQFIINGAPSRLGFLSTQTRCALINHYVKVAPIDEASPTIRSWYDDDDMDCWYEMAQEHTYPEVFDAAIIEVLDHATVAFNQQGLPTTCLFLLKQHLTKN